MCASGIKRPPSTAIKPERNSRSSALMAETYPSNAGASGPRITSRLVLPLSASVIVLISMRRLLMPKPDFLEARPVLAVAEINLSLDHAIEARARAFERSLELTVKNEIGLELDRPLPPHRARVTDLWIERPLPRLARLSRLSGHEAEIAGAECGAITGNRRNVVARLECLVLYLQPGAGEDTHHPGLNGLARARTRAGRI